MSDQILQEIQSLQFHNIQQANQKLKDFFSSFVPFDIATVQVRPLAVSLNSINGFLTTQDGRKLFFKTHIEPESIINEYYNSGILAEVGYPVIQPIYRSSQWGKQLLIYDYFESPSLFNIVWELENQPNQKNQQDQIAKVQNKADQQLWQLYQKSLQVISAQEHSKAPIHQLFYHRLTGGRFQQFYQNIDIKLPGVIMNYDDLCQFKWTINGRKYIDTLEDLVNRATEMLNPANNSTASIIGHGDAHNGNVFYEQKENQLIYFDPAFAGRHSPFLDLTKPLFHNIFAIWMYYPNEVAKNLTINWQIQGDTIEVEHNFIPSPLRLDFLKSKVNNVLKPLVEQLQQHQQLEPNWQEYLKLALFCCPFLTMNLGDSKRFTPEISLLGLSMAMEMGSFSPIENQSLLDDTLELGY